MKMNVLVAAALMFGGMIAPCFAYDGAAGLRSPVTKVTCDTRNEDEQAVCAIKVRGRFVRHKNDNMADHSALAADRLACDTKCGCPREFEVVIHGRSPRVRRGRFELLGARIIGGQRPGKLS